MAVQSPCKIYVDANVYLDFIFDRISDTGREFGPLAVHAFTKIRKGNYKLIVSKWVLEELEEHTNADNVKPLFEMLKDKIIKVTYSDDEVNEAKRLNEEHWHDALHAIIANREGATYLITRNVPHFRPYSDLVEAIRPEEL